MIAAFRKEGQATSRIIWANVVLPVLRWYEYQVSIGLKEEGGCIAMAILDTVLPVLLHQCRNHVCISNSNWVVDKDRLPEVKNLGDRITTQFSHLADKMTTAPSICDAMTLLSANIVILSTSETTLPPFDLTSPVQEHQDMEEFVKIGGAMQSLMREQSSLLFIEPKYDLTSSVKEAMKFNHQPTKQSFSGVKVAAKLMSLLREKWCYGMHTFIP